MKKQKVLAIVGIVIAALLATACKPPAPSGPNPFNNQPPNNPPAAGGGDNNPLIHPLSLQIRTYDCHPEVNPGGGCNDEVQGFVAASVTIMAQTPNGSTPQVVDKTTGAVVPTCQFPGDSTGVPCYTYRTGPLPWVEEQDVQDGMVYMVWQIRVDRVPPLMRVHCEIYSITDMTHPIIQAAGSNDYENKGPNGTTTGDISCGWPVGWALPRPKI